MTTTSPAPGTSASVASIRSQFPALERRHRGLPVAYFDGPGGTQVPLVVVDAMADYLLQHNANTHWVYPTSVETDAALAASREALADLLGGRPSEIAFGANMTTLTFALSRALAKTWRPGVERAGDIAGVTLSYDIQTLPAYGTLSAVANGVVTYTPLASYVGPDSFTWAAMAKGFRIQMPLIAKLRDENKIRIETLGESARWFRERYKTTPATSVTVSEDLGNSDRKTAWFNSRFYRANLLWEKGRLRIEERDRVGIIPPLRRQR